MTYYRTISELPVVATVGYDKGATPHSFAKETTYFVNMKTQGKGTITILRMYTKTWNYWPHCLWINMNVCLWYLHWLRSTTPEPWYLHAGLDCILDKVDTQRWPWTASTIPNAGLGLHQQYPTLALECSLDTQRWPWNALTIPNAGLGMH